MEKEQLQTICLICGKDCLYLGSHVFHAHKLIAKSYKELYRLPHKLMLISPEVREKKQKAFNRDREKYLSNLSTDNSFKKGSKGRFKTYTSDFERKNKIKNILCRKIKGICPICKTSFEHLNSHLFNKHGLIKA